MQPDGAAVMACLVQAHGGFLAVLVKIQHPQPAARTQPRTAVEIEIGITALLLVEAGVLMRVWNVEFGATEEIRCPVRV